MEHQFLTILLSASLAMTAPKAPTAKVEVLEVSATDDDTESCSLACAVGWEVQTSSASPGTPGVYLDDGYASTAWVAAAKDTKPEIVFAFPEHAFIDLETVRFSGFVVAPGFAGSRSQWRSYARPRSLEVLLNGRLVATAELVDRQQDQRISMSDVWLCPGDRLMVRVIASFGGTDGLPVAITSLVPQGAH